MKYDVAVKIFDVPKLPNALGQYGQGRRFESMRWKRIIQSYFIGLAPKNPIMKAKVTITRAGSRMPDPDNLVASVKPVLDGLKSNGIIFDDRSSCLDLVVSFEKTSRKEVYLIVRIQELTLEG